VVELYQSEIFACCTHNNLDECGYEDLGGASNIFVNDHGYCGRLDTGKVCNEIGICAEGVNITTPASALTTVVGGGETFGNTLCNEQILDDVSSYNYFWLNVVMITKCVGLIFLLLLDLRACIKKIDVDEEEAQQADTCFKCKKWGLTCCGKTLVLLFKAFFLIFGTFATFAAIYYMQLTGHVWTSTCSAVPDSLQAKCDATETECNNGDNYYAVVFNSLDLGGPYWADVVSNVLHTTLWIVRVAVMRHALKSTHLADV